MYILYLYTNVIPHYFTISQWVITRFIIMSTGLTLCGFILSRLFFTCSNVGLMVALWHQHFLISCSSVAEKRATTHCLTCLYSNIPMTYNTNITFAFVPIHPSNISNICTCDRPHSSLLDWDSQYRPSLLWVQAEGGATWDLSSLPQPGPVRENCWLQSKDQKEAEGCNLQRRLSYSLKWGQSELQSQPESWSSWGQEGKVEKGYYFPVQSLRFNNNICIKMLAGPPQLNFHIFNLTVSSFCVVQISQSKINCLYCDTQTHL